MTINIKRNSEQATIELAGRLDTVTAPMLNKAISEELAGVRLLTLDMSGVDYVSSAGLRVLLGAQKSLQGVGEMTLTGVCTAVMDVLEMTGFSEILNIKK